MKGFSIIEKLSNVLPRYSLVTIYKWFVWLHLDYEGILYHQPNNDKFFQKIESMQYKAALEITREIKGTSRTKL